MPSSDNLDRRLRKVEEQSAQPDAITLDQYREAAERSRLRAHAKLAQTLGLPSESVEGDADADAALIDAWREQERITLDPPERITETLVKRIIGYSQFEEK